LHIVSVTMYSWKNNFSVIYYKIFFILTFNIQRNWIAFAIALLIATDARVNASAAPGHLLQDQTLVADYRASRRVIVKQFSLCIPSTISMIITLRQDSDWLQVIFNLNTWCVWTVINTVKCFLTWSLINIINHLLESKKKKTVK